MNFSWTAINSAKNLIMINIGIRWLNCLYLRLQRKWVQKFASYHFSIPHPEEIQCSRSYSIRCQMSQTLLIITEPSAFHPIMITKWYKFLSLIHNLYKRKTRNTLHVDQFHGFPFPAKFQYSSQIFYLIPIFFLTCQLLMKPKNKKKIIKKHL